jgi:long-subunit acyl-CoA synthetase (AMP-forming)
MRHCKKNAQVICASASITRIRLQKMSEKVQLNGCVCEVNFGYNARMEGYVNLSLDISMMSKIRAALGGRFACSFCLSGGAATPLYAIVSKKLI